MSIEVVLTTRPIVRPCPMPVSDRCGALAEFYGTVRGEENGRPIRALHYEAYETMAQTLLETIAADRLREHPCHAVRIVHRLGEVPVGEAAIYVGALSAHRREAFAFLAAFMDRLKTDVPIWKTRVIYPSA